MTRLILALAAALLLTTVSAHAQTLQQTPGSRIVVTACDPHIHSAGTGHPWIDPYGVWHYDIGETVFPSFDAFLAISYQNQAPVAATEIDFGLVARGSLIAVAKDVGTFSTGITIDHEFVVSREIFPIGTSLPFCEVLRVKYADGTTWSNMHPEKL